MTDAAHKRADKHIDDFTAEVRQVYQEAEATAQAALDDFLAKYNEDDETMKARVDAGELERSEWIEWRKSKMLDRQRLESVLEQVSQAYVHADEVAMAALSGRLPDVYAESANFAAFQVCKQTGLGLSFALMDASTAQHMLVAGAAILPQVDTEKAAAWDRKLLASQLTQGVLLGESIPKLARRVQRVTGTSVASAVRTARTVVTGAENAARVASYKRAQEMGIELGQEWVATPDDRTRHSHRQLDGEVVEVGEKFSNGCRYPGDPQGKPWEVYNCRCTLVAAVEGADTSDAERWSKLPPGMTYEEWKKGGARPSSEKNTDTSGSAAVYGKLTDSQRGEVERILSSADSRAKRAYLQNEGKFRLISAEWTGTAHFSASDMGVRLNAEKVFSGDKRPSGVTWFHEFGHYIDYLHTGDGSSRLKAKAGMKNADMYLSTSYKGGIFGRTIRKEANEYIDARNKKLRKAYKDAVAAGDIDWLESNGYVSKWTSGAVKRGDVSFKDAEQSGAIKKHSKKHAYKSVADEISAMTDAQKADVSDLFSGATLGKCVDGWRHRKAYWKPGWAPKDYECIPLAKEGFAEFFSAYSANPESLTILRKYFPESSKIFDEMLSEIGG